jgi:hypothetical protein
VLSSELEAQLTGSVLVEEAERLGVHERDVSIEQMPQPRRPAGVSFGDTVPITIDGRRALRVLARRRSYRPGVQPERKGSDEDD